MTLLKVDWNPARQKLRQFSLIWLLAFSLLALIAGWKSGCLTQGTRCALPLLLVLLAFSVGILGLIRPAGVRPIYLVWMGLGFPIGLAISYLLLAVIYYTLFTSLGLILRLVKRDPLVKSRDPRANSYWTHHKPAEGIRRYFQQF